MRHNISGFIFDRLQGTKIFTKSVGGVYVDVAKGQTHLNPFCCDDTPQNRAFIYHFLLMLANIQDKEATTLVTRAVDLIFNLPTSKRILTNFIDIVFPANSCIKQSLIPWVGSNPLAQWFNGTINNDAYDALNFTDTSLVAFEMTDIQKFPLVSAAVSYYLMHKIRQGLQQSAKGHMIFIDETKPMLQHKQFRQYVEEMFLEHRKLRGSVNVCFQDAGSLMKEEIGQIILEQCPTKFFFPNTNAKKEHFKEFNLTDFEWAYILNKLPISRTLKRSVLIKKENESVILDISMHGITNLLKLYKSGSKEVKLADELISQYGDGKWVEHYINR